MLKNKYTATIELFYSDEDGGYVATVNALPGVDDKPCISGFGETIEGVLLDLGTALQLLLEVHEEDAP